MYSKIVNPINGNTVSIKSRLGKSILENYLKALNKQKGGTMTKFNPAMFTNMCDLGKVQCGAICANWLGVEQAFIEALLWESGSAEVPRSLRPEYAHSSSRSWSPDSGISDDAMTSILARHKDAIIAGDLDTSLADRGITVDDASLDDATPVFFQTSLQWLRGEWRPKTLETQFDEILERIEIGYATILNIAVEGGMGHYVIIGKFPYARRWRRFIIDPQHHTGIISGDNDFLAHKRIVKHLKKIWEDSTLRLGMYTDGVVLDATNYRPVNWDGTSFATERHYTPGYATLPADMRLCRTYNGKRGSCLHQSGDDDEASSGGSRCFFVHNRKFVKFRSSDWKDKKKLCKFFVDGAANKCTKGSRCLFSHDGPDDEDGAASTWATPKRKATRGSATKIQATRGSATKICSVCQNAFPKSSARGDGGFSNNQWNKAQGRRCPQCIADTQQQRRRARQRGGNAEKSDYLKSLKELFKNHNNSEFISKVLPKLATMRIKLL